MSSKRLSLGESFAAFMDIPVPQEILEQKKQQSRDAQVQVIPDAIAEEA